MPRPTLTDIMVQQISDFFARHPNQDAGRMTRKLLVRNLKRPDLAEPKVIHGG